MRALGGAAPRADHTVENPMPPPDFFPGYEVLREIHRGGQGIVYLAIQGTTKRRVAIKMMHESPFAGSAGKARFEREVQILGQLVHPNIVRIHDSGSTPAGNFFYVMDYVSGQPLDEYINRNRNEDIRVTLKLFAKICEAVSAAHLRGVIHRDIKPSNIRIDANGEPILVDFGLAKIAIPGLPGDDDETPRLMTMTGQFVGSLPWASPEQAEGNPSKIDLRTDVYSLGVILYQMLTGGKFPYEVVGAMRDVLNNILQAAPARPSTIRRKINDEVETIVLKCLAKERERRYQSASELARDVTRYLLGEPIEAKRDSGLYVLGKALKRHRVPVAAFAAFVVLVTGFAIAMSYLYDQSVKAERKTRDAYVQIVQQKQRADGNLQAIRDLTRTFMTGFHDKIRTLKGATAARELLLVEARTQIDRIAAQAGDDPEIMRQLADANDLVGDLEGGLVTIGKLGDTKAAQAAYARAYDLRKTVRARMPDDPRAVGDVAISLGKLASVESSARRHQAAADAYSRAVLEADQAINLASGSPETAGRLREERIELVRRRGSALIAAAEQAKEEPAFTRFREDASVAYAEVLSFWRGRQRDKPFDEAGARGVAVATDRLAWIAIVTAQRMKEPIARARSDRTAAEQAAQAAVSAFALARPEAEKAFGEFSRLAERRPASAEFARSMNVCAQTVGFSHMEEGNVWEMVASQLKDDAFALRARDAHARALQWYDKALEITRRLASADEANIEAQRDLATALNKVGNQYLDLGRVSEALSVYDQSLRIRDELLRTDPVPMHRRDVGLAHFKLGQTHDRLGRDSARSIVDRRASCQAAIGHLERALAEFGALRDAGAMAADSQDIIVTSRLLEGVRGRLGNLPAGG